MEENTSNYTSETFDLANRIIKIKIRLLCEHPFFGLLAQQVKLAIATDVQTACTDGERIFFGAEFSKNIGDEELYFVFFHELMHIVYKHCFRSNELNNRIYNIASDIVINSVILDELHMSDILILGNPLMHKTPKGEEGRLFTAEEVYEMLVKEGEKDPMFGNLIVKNGGGSGKGNHASKNGDNTKQKRDFTGKSTFSNDNPSDNNNKKKDGGKSDEEKEKSKENDNDVFGDFFFDEHDKWGQNQSNELNEAKWTQNIYNAVKVMKESNQAGCIPSLAERMVEEIENPPIDWRSVLINFLSAEVFDYSFAPPDKRYGSDGCLLPDFNEKNEKIENIWIAIDSSGSISNYQLSLALNEIKGAIEQFNGRFSGWISYFDYHVTKPQPFENLEDVKSISVKGGGGTSFENIFKAKSKYFVEDLSSIIIITDGYAPWPKEEQAEGVPVLWLFNNLKVKPPWGMVARMNIKNRN